MEGAGAVIGRSRGRVLRREQLVSEVLDLPTVGMIEAPAGFGKTMLLHLVARSGRGIDLVSGPDGSSRIVETTGRVLLVDDVDRLPPEDLALLVQTIAGLAPHRKVVLAGRRIPPVLGRPQVGPEVGVVSTERLAFSETEVRALLGLAATDRTSTETYLLRAIGGWPALAGAVAGHLAESETSSSSVPVLQAANGLLARLAGACLAPLDEEDRSHVLQLAHLPTFVPEIADALSVGLFDRLRSAGLMMLRCGDGTLRLGDPVRAHLRSLAPLCPVAVDQLSPALVRAGRHLDAAWLLVRAGRSADAATLMSVTPRPVRDACDQHWLIGLLEMLRLCRPDDARLLLQLSRAHGNLAEVGARRRCLEEAELVAHRADDDCGSIGDEVAVELLIHRVDAGETQDLSARLDGIGARISQDDAALATRLLEGRGLALARANDPLAKERGVTLLHRAALTWRELGETSHAVAVLRTLAVDGLLPLGRYVDAAHALDEARRLSSAADLERLATSALASRIDALLLRRERILDLAEATELARQLGVRWGGAYVEWARMLFAAADRSAEEVAVRRDRAWQFLGELREHPTGTRFLSEAVSASAKVGLVEDARSLLCDLRPRTVVGEPDRCFAELSVLAQAGASKQADDVVAGVLRRGTVPPGRRWQLVLGQAVAREAAGSGEVDDLLRRVEHEAACLGLQGLPQRMEPQLFASPSTEGAAGAVTRPVRVVPPRSAPIGRTTDQGRVVIRLLGGFRVTREGRDVEMAGSKSVSLLKLLAIREGTAPIDLVLDALWPDASPAVGRRRLKNVVSRTRAVLGPVVVRSADLVMLDQSVRIDLALFNESAMIAAQAMAQGVPDAGQLALQALHRYTGPLLPDDLYDDVVGAARHATNGRAAALVDAMIGMDVEGEPSPASALLETLLKIEPVPVAGLRSFAAWCLLHGHSAVGLTAAERAATAEADLGIELAPAAKELLQALTCGPVADEPPRHELDRGRSTEWDRGGTAPRERAGAVTGRMARPHPQYPS